VPAIFCQLCSLFILFFADFRSCKHFSTSWRHESHGCFHSKCSRTFVWCLIRCRCR
jgi:hypothetical protein